MYGLFSGLSFQLDLFMCQAFSLTVCGDETQAESLPDGGSKLRFTKLRPVGDWLCRFVVASRWPAVGLRTALFDFNYGQLGYIPFFRYCISRNTLSILF